MMTPKENKTAAHGTDTYAEAAAHSGGAGRGGGGAGRGAGAQSGLVTIIKKEFARFFTDRRMVLTTLLLPGLMIFAFYSLIGNSLSSMLAVDEDYVPVIYAVNLPDSLKALCDEAGLPFEAASPDEADGIRERIQDKEADLLVVFPASFDDEVGQALAQGGGGGVAAAQVELYYNSTRTESRTMYANMAGLLDGYRNALAPLFTVNAGEDSYDLATEKDAAGFSFASMLPLLIITFLISGCMGLAIEAIAGEKERGTMATMLITPLARWELALGKVISLGIIALLSGLSSFIGIMLALPRVMSAKAGDAVVDAAVYGFGDYAMLLVVTLSTVLLFVGLMSVLSAFARTIKEAGTFVMPFMVIVMLVGVLGMFTQGAATEPWFYLIPVYNSVQSLVGVFSFSAVPLLVALTVSVNLVVTALCVLALAKMFNSERVIFSR
jgi:sodium transport system permease protein